ncbi:MAG: hypothetical protein GPJ51_15225, partial [Candidatus Heimdallarchaeota archaeon]|nr:hypothetical protein [Candidatus Heimdallarchaeota archaeon]
PSLAVDSFDNVHVVWEDFTDYTGSGSDCDIFYKLWNASTSSWITTEVVSTASTSASDYPSLAVDSFDNVHVVWADLFDYGYSGSDRDIFYKLWNASTSSWTTIEVVSTESTENSADSSLAVDSFDNVHVVWTDWTLLAGIFYKLWNASTSSWTTFEVVTPKITHSATDPSLAVDSSGNVHVVFETYDDYSGSGTDQDIVYKKRFASTSSWTSTEVVTTDSILSLYPSLAVDSSGNAHIVWMNENNYNDSGTDWDIFYRSTTFEQGTETETETTTASLQGLVVFTSLIFSTYIFLFVVTRTRRKDSKSN